MIDRGGRRSRLVVSAAAGAAAPARRRVRVGRAVVARPAVGAPHGDAAAARAPRAAARRDARSRRRPARPSRTGSIRNGQTPRLREMLWDPLALAALNQPPDQAAAPPFARVLAEMFGADPRAAAIALPTKPLHLMYAEPARAFIERTAATVRTGAPATIRVDATARVAGVDAGGERWPARRVICGRAVVRARRTCSTATPRRAARTSSSARGAMASSPIVTVNLWFDRPVLDEPFVGLPGRAMQWVFDKRLVFGDEASHLSLVSSGAAALAGRDERGADRAGARRAARRAARRPRRRGCCARPSSASRARRSRWRPASRRGRRRATPRAGAASGRRLDRHGSARYDRERGPQRPPRPRHRMRLVDRCQISNDRFMNSIVVHYKELALKGKNRPGSSSCSCATCRRALAGLDVATVRSVMGRIEIELGPDAAVGRGARAAPPRLRHRELLARRTAAPLDFDALAAAILDDLGDVHARVVPRVGDARRQAASVHVAADRARGRRADQGGEGLARRSRRTRR